MSNHPATGLTQTTVTALPVTGQNPVEQIAPTTADHLFHLYEKVLETRPGSRDAEIFEKIREWTFSDFSNTAYEFAGISKSELDAWQTRHRINLSAGQIRPDPIDLQRGYAWGQMRMAAAANRLHSDRPPPSALEVTQSWLPATR
jgi:hypothetical protein